MLGLFPPLRSLTSLDDNSGLTAAGEVLRYHNSSLSPGAELKLSDKSSDLFLFWGSLGFFTGGLRFGGFSRLLGLSLSVPASQDIAFLFLCGFTGA